MSEIRKYQMALRHRTNPRYLTRDFIVPMYTGTEPDILDDSNTQQETGGYTPFPNDMPIVSPKEIQNQPYEQLQLADGGSVERRGFELGGDVQDWAIDTYPEVNFNFKKYPKFGVDVKSENYDKVRKAISKKITNPSYSKTTFDLGINRIADAFLKSYAEDDVSYLTSKSEFNKKGMLSPNDISFYRAKIKSPTFIQDIVDKTGLKAENILDLMDERETFIELDLRPTIAGKTKQGATEKTNEIINQGEDWLIKNSKNYDNVEDLKKGFKRVLGKDHPFLKQTLRTSYGMPKLNPLFYEGKQKVYQTHGSPAFVYGAPEMKNLFQASLYNFNPTVRDKVLNEINDILPKTKITEGQKYDLRKRFENSKTLSELGINKRLSGPVTRLLIKDLGENILEDINFIKTPRLNVLNYINFLKDRVDPKYKEQFNLVNKALRQVSYRNYDGAKETFGIVENINLDHRVPKYLIDAGYADEIEYIKLNPTGERFNMVAKNKTFDAPIARLSREYEATSNPEDKAKIVKKMNELKDNFNKRHNNYLSDISIKEVEGKLNVSSSLKPITSADEFIKTLETNVKQNPELFKITAGDKRKIIQEIGNFGCGIQNKAMGGRITFSEGSDCFNKGLKMLEEGKVNIQQLKSIEGVAGEGENASKIIKNLYTFGKEGGKLAGRGLGEIISIGSGPIGLVAGAALETAFAAPNILEGDYKQALRQSILGQGAELLGKDIGSVDEDVIKKAKEIGANENAVRKFIDLKKNFIENEKYGERLNMLDEMYKRDPKNMDYVEQIRRLENKLKPSEEYLKTNIYSPKEIEQMKKDYINSLIYHYEKSGEVSPFGRTQEQIKSSARKQAEETFGAIYSPEEVDTILEKSGLPKQQPQEQPIQEDLTDYYKVSAADGGRIGLSEGSGPKMGRRGFLGLLAAGAAATPEIIKGLKGEKKVVQAAKLASKIKLEKAEGMYPWFPDLVEKIKVKGKPFEEKDLIMEASYKHEAKGYGGLPKGIEKLTKHVDGDTEFILREYPDGRIAVDIHSPRNQEMFETPVTLYYRPTMELTYNNSKKIEPAEFKVLEKEPRYFANGPDDVDIELSETRKIPGKDTIYGDVEAAERFATGDIKNRKVIKVKQSRRDQMMDQPTDFIEETSPYGSYE
jgi:hypothetical protein